MNSETVISRAAEIFNRGPEARAQLKAELEILIAIANAIRELGQVPEGKLYTIVCSKLSLERFEKAIDHLVAAGVVSRGAGYLLHWIGPSNTVNP